MTNTTMNTGAASLSDEQILNVLCGQDERPFHQPHGTRLVYNAFEDEYDLREIVLRRARELIALASTPQADAAIAAGGAQEPIYQQQYCNERVWRDLPKDRWDEKQAGTLASYQRFRIVYAATAPNIAATLALTDEALDAAAMYATKATKGGLPTSQSWRLEFARSLLVTHAPQADAAIAAGGAQEAVAFDHHEVDHGTHIELVPHYAAPLPREATTEKAKLTLCGELVNVGIDESDIGDMELIVGTRGVLLSGLSKDETKALAPFLFQQVTLAVACDGEKK
jgi:hypothetical protein